MLAWKVLFTRGFDVIHACNPPDLFFLIGGFFKLFGKKFVFDHHDINPELYEAKFGRRDFFWKLMVALERWTFRTADVSIATNESYRRIAIERGGMDPERVFVVRSGPEPGAAARSLPPDAVAEERPQAPRRLRRRHGQAGGHRPAAAKPRATSCTSTAAPTCTSASWAAARRSTR